MQEYYFAELANQIRKKNGLVLAMNWLDKAITYITVLLYGGLLAYGAYISGWHDFTLLYRSVLIPGIAFIVVSVFRKKVSSPRPYEVYNFVPVIKKDTKGKSFPSRHVFSVFMVAMAYGQISVIAAMWIGVVGIILAFLRVVGGVHFIKDVIAGAAIAIICGGIGFGLLCGVFGIGVLLF